MGGRRGCRQGIAGMFSEATSELELKADRVPTPDTQTNASVSKGPVTIFSDARMRKKMLQGRGGAPASKIRQFRFGLVLILHQM